MHPNFLFVPTLLGAAALCALGLKISPLVRSAPAMAFWLGLAGLLAVPALLFVAYYSHILDRAAWFYSFRAAPDTELSAAGLGLGLGLILGWLKQRHSPPDAPPRLAPVLVVFCVGLLMLPYVKPILAPLRKAPQNRWSQGVALQTTPATCGPSSAVTLLRQFHIPASERELARECFSYRGGTKNWYVARALQRRALQTQYIVTSPQTTALPFPSIAGVQLGGKGGHFITLLGRSGPRTIIGDPLVGKLVLTSRQMCARYYFTGFFLVARKRA